MRKGLNLTLLALCATLLAGTAVAGSIPQSSCTVTAGPNNSGPSFTCNLYPSDPLGNLNDQVTVGVPPSSIIDDPIGTGFVVLVKPGSDISSGYDPTRADWTQVLSFNDNGLGQAINMTLYTLGCNNLGNINDNTCFPAISVNDISQFAFEPSAGVYLYQPGDTRDHEYTMHFVSESPEPATAGLLGIGLVAILTVAKRRISRRSLSQN
jgi:hypothetical protein